MTNQTTNKQRNKFKFHTIWYKALQHFAQEEKGMLFESILEYVFHEKEITLPTHLKSVFEFLKYQIDESLENEKVSLYVIKLYDSHESFFKIGIASNIKKRIQSFTNIGYDLIRFEGFETRFNDREQALNFEKRLHDELYLFQHFPKKKFGGQFECFSEECFNSIDKAIKKIKEEIEDER